jgi:SAM-dependent methyltransferase
MSTLRQRLFETYDVHYLRGNMFAGEKLTQQDYRRRIREYEAQFGETVSRFPSLSEVADVGCGTGFLVYWLASTRNAQHKITGVDLSDAQLQVARQYVPEFVQLVHKDALTFLRENPARFGGIFCTDVLEHIDDEDAMLELLEASKAALVSGGYFVCRVPNMANLVSPQLRYIDLTHKRGFTSLSLLQLLECSGFSECKIVDRRAADFGQAVRMGVERLLHGVVYRICGVGNERHFSRTLVGVGRAE